MLRCRVGSTEGWNRPRDTQRAKAYQAGWERAAVGGLGVPGPCSGEGVWDTRGCICSVGSSLHRLFPSSGICSSSSSRNAPCPHPPLVPPHWAHSLLRRFSHLSGPGPVACSRAGPQCQAPEGRRRVSANGVNGFDQKGQGNRVPPGLGCGDTVPWPHGGP